MIEQLIAEATECDFKVALEIKKPKSQLKSVSSFSNGIGGTLFFGISDDRKPIGLSDVQKDHFNIKHMSFIYMWSIIQICVFDDIANYLYLV